MTDSTRARLPRKAKQRVVYDSCFGWAPGLVSDNLTYNHVDLLNKQAFPHNEFSALDDLVLRCLCGSKSHPNRWSAVIPDLSSFLSEVWSGDAHALQQLAEASAKCYDLTHPAETHTTPLKLLVDQCADHLMQYSVFHPVTSRRKTILRHLLYRYALLYQPDSCIRMIKVQFLSGGAPSFGLRAVKNIPGGTYIMETCSSMSSDIAKDDGPSIIEAAGNQLGPVGRRSILGPFRCANHDCNPNAQILLIERTHAATIVTLRDIQAGEELTVKYGKDGYYYEGKCLCSTCEHRPTTVLKRCASPGPSSSKEQESDAHRSKRKKTRRGGGAWKKGMKKGKSRQAEEEKSIRSEN